MSDGYMLLEAWRRFPETMEGTYFMNTLILSGSCTIVLPIFSSIDLFHCTWWKKSNGGGRWASFLPLQDCGGDTGHSILMPEVLSRGNDKDTIAGVSISMEFCIL
jgi:hypothetical protein